MKKSHVIILGLCLLFCFGVLFALYALSPISKEIYRAEFKRKFIGRHAVTQKAILDVDYNSFYIAGINNEKIYLGNSTAPAHLLVADVSLKDTAHLRLHLADVDTVMDPRRFRLTVDSPYFYMAHGIMPLILRGITDNWTASKFMTNEGYFFNEAVPIGKGSFAFRSFHSIEKSWELAKKTADTLIFHNELLNKQIDGVFCVDGELTFNYDLNRLIFVHFYRNEIVVADTNLSLKYRAHTIDTFSRARIKVATVNTDDNTSMLAAPPMQINSRPFTDHNLLYIHSNVLSSNEVIEHFINDSVVDVYDLSDSCRYRYSFYIPAYKGYKASSVKLKGKTLVAIHDHYLITYDINTQPSVGI